MFEIITSDNRRLTFTEPETRWQWGVKAGTMDEDDFDMIEVVRGDEVILRVPNPEMVGEVDAMTHLRPRERWLATCPKCGRVDNAEQ